VGTCAQCQKTACRDCIEDLGGALLCAGCISIHQQQAQAEEEAAEVDRQAMMRWAKTRVQWSWVVASGGILFGFFPGIMQASDVYNRNNLGAFAVVALPAIVIFFAILSGYIFWCLYWSIPIVWGWTKQFVSVIGIPDAASLPAFVIILSCCISLPLSVAIYYGVFGGGIYQYFKYRRIAAGRI
jgi:hypothetical protein